MEAALEAGAEDVITHDDGSIEVVTAPYEFARVKAALEKAGFKAELAEVTMKPANETEMAGDDAVKMQKLLDALEVPRRRAGGLHHGGRSREWLKPVRILGIDPGLGITGYGVIEKHGSDARLRRERAHPLRLAADAAAAPRARSSRASPR